MIKPELLAILCCPETHQPLTEASAEVVANINRRITSGEVKNRSGEILSEPLQGALLREDKKFFYPVRKDIPVLLVDQASPL